MDRNRDVRRAAMVTTSGLSRRRHRTSSLRDSPEDDGMVELQETSRLRDRTNKKDRDRDREKARDRDLSGRSRRRRGDKFSHGIDREDGDDSSVESANDENEEDPDDGPVGCIAPNPVSMSSSASLTDHRKSYPPPAKVSRACPSWKPADEMIGVSVPRKARTASTKRSHEWSSGGVGDQIQRQASASPVGPSLVSVPPKPNGLKQRSAKSASKSSASIQDDIEIEVAEVLYGLMRQSQSPSKVEIMSNDSAKLDSPETNRLVNDSKSRVSSPIFYSPSILPQPSSILQQNSSSSAPPLSAIAPKRKRPRPVIFQEENLPVFVARSDPLSSMSKAEADGFRGQDGTPPSFGKNSISGVENSSVLYDLMKSHRTPSALTSQSESPKPEHGSIHTDAKPLMGESGSRDGVTVEVEAAPPISLKESTDNWVDSPISSKASSAIVEKENHWEDKFEIDLMSDLQAPPPQLKKPPESAGETEYESAEDAKKALVADDESGTKPKPIEEDEAGKGYGGLNAEEGEQKKANLTQECLISTIVAEKADPRRLNLNNERKIDVQLDLKNGDTPVSGDRKLNQPLLKDQAPKTSRDDGRPGRIAESSSLRLQMSAAAIGWPGGPPPMGYVAPLQGVASMDGSTMSSPAIQSRRKRCMTHCYIALNIQSHQQFARMNTFWPAPAWSTPIFGAKTSNLNMSPSADLHGNVAGRSINPVHDKGEALAFFPGQPGSKDKGSQGSNIADGAQKKQFLLQQSLPPGAPSNILHGPAFVFSLGQQQAAAASASAYPASLKSGAPVSNVASTSMSYSSPTMSSSTVSAPMAATMSFSFPNMSTNEAQYLAIMGNSPYPFPIPAPPYRGSHAHAVPFIESSFYSSQRLHAPQLHQQQPPPSKSHQNTSISTTSSSSQKHLPNQQQMAPGSGANRGSINPSLQTFPVPKNRASQSIQHQMGSHDSPSTADNSSMYRPNMSFYSHNLSLPIHTGVVGNVNGNHGEKPLLPLSSGIESLTPPGFSVSFASVHGAATPGPDISTVVQNHAILPMLPTTTQQRKTYWPTDDNGKAGDGDSSRLDDEKTAMAVKVSPSVSTTTGNQIVNSSGQSLNPVTATTRASHPSVPNALGNSNAAANLQHQQSNAAANLQHQQMIHHLQKQRQFAAASSKFPATTNGSSYADHLPSSSTTTMSTALRGFPPLVQSNSSQAKFPPWKNSSMAASSQTSYPSVATSVSASMKSLPQQGHTHVSFGANPISSTPSNGQQAPSSHQAAPTSLISKSASGKNSPPAPIQKQSSVHGWHAPSILGSPHITTTVTTTSAGVKQSQQKLPPQLQHQQISKQSIQEAQSSFFSAHNQTHAPHNLSTTPASAASSGYYLQRHRPDQQPTQKSTGSASTSANVVCSSTSDPAKKAAAAAAAAAVAHISRQSPTYAHQLAPPGFPCVASEDKQPGGSGVALPKK
ncbi:hypothetical protein Nepgr_031104 [Nepenthes gracilis]|uniref:Protein TIME FOR COFFEE n=1 Tax=Nepenthes gracilis TaxID=150966 RepID=A0AAD3THG9_NEPGR|nr:hypothetical protein Nepgr_031104 [Nepenthes gracilis]